MTTSPTLLTRRYAEAVEYAAVLHATHTRKGTDIPYICHLLGVSSLVLEAGGSEDQAIAGLLHDAVEDAGGLPRLADIRARFGDEVAEIVLACSDSTDEEWKASTPYEERKRAYLDRLASEPPAAVLVSIADKVHNARAILTDLQAHGPAVMRKFNAGSEAILGYYSECLRIAEASAVPGALVLPLRTALSAMTELIGEVDHDQ